MRPPPASGNEPTERPAPRTITGSGHSVALRGRIPAAALARGTDPPASRIAPPPHAASVTFGAHVVAVEVEGDRVSIGLPGTRVVGTRAEARDLIDALLEALTH